VAVGLGITFKGQNVAFMVSLAFAIAASANFPALALAMTLIYPSPTIQVDILQGSAWFPLKNPALVTLPLSFLAGILVSLLAPEPDAAAGFTRLERQTHLGTVLE